VQQRTLVTVGISDLKITKVDQADLITYALGSCLGITAWDPVVKVGAMLHAMLPTSEVDPEKAAKNPFMFVDTGVPAMFQALTAKGANLRRIVVKVAGGARIGGSEKQDMFQIGKRNFVTLRKVLWNEQLLIASQDVGGSKSRTMVLDVASGEVSIKSNGEISTL